MPRFPLSSDSAINRVSAALLLVAAGFLLFVWQSPEPWKGESLKKVAKRLEVDKDEVPWRAFFDFETLGEQNPGVEVYRQIGLWQGGLIVGVVLVFLCFDGVLVAALNSAPSTKGRVVAGAGRGEGGGFSSGEVGLDQFGAHFAAGGLFAGAALGS